MLVKTGAFKGLRTTVTLLRMVIPVYLIVALVGHTGAYLWIASLFAPAMRIFGLPGEAVVPVITGFFSDEYSVVAAIGAFSFNQACITIISVMVLCAHNIPVEVVIARKIGLSPWKVIIFRIATALIAGIVVAYMASVFIGGAPPAFFPGTEATSATASGSGGLDVELNFDLAWGVILPQMGLGILRTVLTIARVVIPMMIVIEIMLAYHIVQLIAKKLSSIRLLLGIGQDALLPLIVGLMMGVTYGAGAIIELNRTQPLSKKDTTLLGIFLFSCHAILESTYLFTVAGANIFIMTIARLAIAVCFTAVAARFGIDMSAK